MVKVRVAKIKDLPEVVKLKLELMRYEAKLDNYWAVKRNVKKTIDELYKKSLNSKKSRLIVAEEKNEIIGFGYANLIKMPFYEIKTFGFINDMYVKDEFRKKGIAGKILKLLFKWFKSKKVNNVMLNVICKNKIGYKAWTKYGFKDCLIRKKITLK